MEKRAGGQLFTFGSSEFGVLGTGQKKNRGNELVWEKCSAPTQVETLSDVSVTDVACALRHSLVITEKGQVYSWGTGFWGQLGHGNQEDQLLPKRIESLTNQVVVGIACSSFHSACITIYGKLYTWGSGKFGQLGHGNCESCNVPTLVEALQKERVIKVACGTTFTVVVTEKGEVYSFGENCNGALGLGDKFQESGATFSETPRKVKGVIKGLPVVSAACGNYHCAVITKKGELFTWGNGKYGQLGHNDPVDLNKPRKVASLAGRHIIEVSCGNFFSAAISNDGKLFVWGYDGEQHKLGLGEDNVVVRMPEQLRALSKKKIKHISCGANHMAAISSTGELLVWGGGSEGQLGLGAQFKSVSSPKLVKIVGKTTANFIRVSCGWIHTAAITTLGALDEIRKLKESRSQTMLMNNMLKEELESLKKKMQTIEQNQQKTSSSSASSASGSSSPTRSESRISTSRSIRSSSMIEPKNSNINNNNNTSNNGGSMVRSSSSSSGSPQRAPTTQSSSPKKFELLPAFAPPSILNNNSSKPSNNNNNNNTTTKNESRRSSVNSKISPFSSVSSFDAMFSTPNPTPILPSSSPPPILSTPVLPTPASLSTTPIFAPNMPISNIPVSNSMMSFYNPLTASYNSIGSGFRPMSSLDYFTPSTPILMVPTNQQMPQEYFGGGASVGGGFGGGSYGMTAGGAIGGGIDFGAPVRYGSVTPRGTNTIDYSSLLLGGNGHGSDLTASASSNFNPMRSSSSSLNQFDAMFLKQ